MVFAAAGEQDADVVVGPGEVAEGEGGVVHCDAGHGLVAEAFVGDVVDELAEIVGVEVVRRAEQIEHGGGCAVGVADVSTRMCR